MFCPKCGNKNPDENLFCQACGTRMSVPLSAAPPYSSPKVVKPGPAKKRKTRIIIITSALVAALAIALVLILTGNPLQKTKISDDATYYLTVADGWVYYNGGTLADNGTTLNNVSFYKVRADGSEKTKLGNDVISGIIVIDNWIYYLGDDTGTICKMRTDGSDNILVHDVDGDVELFTVADGWIYYFSKALFDPGIYKIRTDGSEETRLSSDDFNLFDSVAADVADGWIYYCSNDDDHLYRIRMDGSDRTKLSDDTAEYLTVADGWIYYYGGALDADGESIDSGYYKMRTDGSGKTKILNYAEYFTIAGGFIYYSSYDGIYRIRTDGSEETKLSNDHYAEYFTVEDGWIYYFITREYGIYRMQTGVDAIDGGATEDIAYNGKENNTKATETPPDPDGSASAAAAPDDTPAATPAEVRGNSVSNTINEGLVAQADGWIYYTGGYSEKQINGRYYYSFAIYKMRDDGTQKTKLSDDFLWISGGSACRGPSINVVDDWVYYYTEKSDTQTHVITEGGIYKMRTDGSDITKLSDAWAKSINVVDGWIYYSASLGGTKCAIYKMRTDGSDVQKLADDAYYYAAVTGGRVYYHVWLTEVHAPMSRVIDEGIYSIATDGTDKKKLICTDWDSDGYYIVDGEWLYYCDRSGVHKIRTDGTEYTKLSDGRTTRINIAGGWIYYVTEDGIYKMHTDGSEVSQLIEEDPVERINVVNDWIYYYNYKGFFRMRTDGSEHQFVE